MNRKKIAVLLEGNIYNQKGMFNAARSRIKYLNEISDAELNVFVFDCYEPWIIRKLRRTQKKVKIENIHFDGIVYKVIWSRYSLIDYILSVRFARPTIFRKLFYNRQHHKFQDYDLIETHSLSTSGIALSCYKKYKIPFVCTWHGSDIHSIPFRSSSKFDETKTVIESAACNFFVSDALLKTSDKITIKGRKEVLYNGASEIFRILPNRHELRLSYNKGKKIIAFVGNLFPIKNVLSLPEIFKSVYNRNRKVEFWIIGDGKLENPLRELCLNLPVVFHGKREPGEMPALMNCIDVLILPSFNEGLPLVTVEALKCGCNVVGSDVGGIAEVIGQDNVFNLVPHDKFIKKIADRCCDMISQKVAQQLPLHFDWRITSKKELSIIKEIIDL